MKRNTLSILSLLTLALIALSTACADDRLDPRVVAPEAERPTLLSTQPLNGATDVALNTGLLARFSMPMDSTTITNASFTLTRAGGIDVPGSVSYDEMNHAATFTPLAQLAASFLYTATIKESVASADGATLAAEESWSFSTGAAADMQSPMLSFTSPQNAALNVPVNQAITATFSEHMNPMTFSGTTFALTDSLGAPIAATVVCLDATATLTPTANLPFDAEITATIAASVSDLAGNTLGMQNVWTFNTGMEPDTIAPTVTSISPAADAMNVPVNQALRVVFSEEMNSATLTSASFSLKKSPNIAVPGTLLTVGLTTTLTPSAALAYDTMFTATISTNVRDLAGNALSSSYSWSFTTGNAPDTTRPTVDFTNPIVDEMDVPKNRAVIVVFSELMNSASVSTSTFTLATTTGAAVTGTVTCPGTTATFTPASDLLASTTYTATILASVRDLAGNSLAAGYQWDFTTGANAALGPRPVVLGSAGNYVVLAKSAVSTTGVTAVTGSIGLSPAAGTYITGFSETMHASNTYSTSSVVTGRLYAANYTAPTPVILTTAVEDMETAYTDAAGRSNPTATELGAGNIDAMTLAPGLYKWGTGVDIPIVLTLTGGPNDVWIFQVAQDLNVGNGAMITLSGGALAKNVFWQVGGMARLGTGSHFEGILLCQTNIVCETGGTMNGRAVAQTAVTLDATALTQP